MPGEDGGTSENPYMFNAHGPKKRIDYTKPEDDDNEDQVMYDLSEDNYQLAATGESGGSKI